MSDGEEDYSGVDQSTGVSVQIELQVDDMKRLENHEAVAFGDVEITLSAGAARYLYTRSDADADSYQCEECGVWLTAEEKVEASDGTYCDDCAYGGERGPYAP